MFFAQVTSSPSPFRSFWTLLLIALVMAAAAAIGRFMDEERRKYNHTRHRYRDADQEDEPPDD